MNRTSRASMLAMLAFGSLAGLGTTTLSSQDVRNATALERTMEMLEDAVAQPATKPARSVSLTDITKAILASQRRGSRPSRYPNGPGWTHAHVQRMARKRRNVRRNRRAHR